MWFVFIWQFSFILRVPSHWILTMTTASILWTLGIGHRTSSEMLVSVCLLFDCFMFHVCESDLCVACCKGLADRFEEYPKLRELIRLKDELIATTNTPPMYAKWILMFIWLWVQLIYAWITVHLECVHSTLLIPPFVMLQPYFKRDEINFSPQNPLIWFDFLKVFLMYIVK